MKTLSLKLDEKVYSDTEEILSKLKKPRNRYINEAIEYYNAVKKKELIAKQLAFESKLVSEESMKVLKEFEEMDDYEELGNSKI
jgi:predicted transcriptional regulator